MHKPSRLYTLAAIILLAIFYLRLAAVTGVKSDTYDELKCLHAGEYLAKNFNWDIESVIYHPPLSYLTHGLLLKDRQFKDTDEKVRYARLIMMVFPVLLGIFIYRFGRKEFGPAAGLAALFLYTFEPNVIAMSCLIQPDMFAAAFTFIGFYFYRKALRDGKSAKKLMVAGFAAGLAFLSKYNGVFLVFIMAVLEAKEVWFVKSVKFGIAARRFVYVCLIGIAVLNLGYGFKGSFKPLNSYTFESTFFSKAASIPVLSSIPTPFPEGYLYGFDAQKNIAEAGHPTFLMGEKSVKGWWYYFPVAFLIKTPIPLAVLLILALLYKPSRKTDLMIAVACLTLPFVLMTNSNPGVRYLLPAFPFLVLIIGDLVYSLYSDRTSRHGKHTVIERVFDVRSGGRKAALAGLSAAFIWFGAESAAIHPNYIAYFNELIGGPKNGWKYLADSNIDWGQDRFLVMDFLKKNPEYTMNPGKPAAGKFIINVNTLQDVFSIGEKHGWLKSFDPVGNIGYSWLLYDIKPEYFKGLVSSHPESAEANYIYGVFAGDKAALRKAVELDPNYEKARLELAELYMKEGEYADAARELRLTAEKDPGAHRAFEGLRAIAFKTGDAGLMKFYEKRYKVAKALGSYAVKVNTDEEYYRKLLAVDNGNAKAWNNLGFIYWSRNENVKAEECFRKAYALKPYMLDYIANLLVLYDETGRQKSQEYDSLVREYNNKYNLASSARVQALQYGEEKMILEDILLLPVERSR